MAGEPRTEALRRLPALLASRLRRLLPALWFGALLSIAFVAAPAPFAVLAPADAGRVNGRLFAHEAWASVVLALVVVLLERRRARGAAAVGAGSAFSTETLLALGALFCTVAGYFAVQPMLASARLGQGVLGFGTLHAASVALFGLKLLLVGALAWRAAAA